MILFLCISTLDSTAQRHPHVGYAYPAGGQQGASVEVRVGGQYLGGAMGVHVSGDGVSGAVGEYSRPIPQKRVNEMREKLKKVRSEITQARKQGKITSPEEGMRLFIRLAGEEGITRDELIKAAEFRRQQQDPKRQLNPQIAESVSVKLTIDPEAETGLRELRLQTRAGLSNPVRFCIGDRPELCEAASTPGYTWEYLAMTGRWTQPKADPQDGVTRVRLPAVVNGQVMPGEVDRFRFKARKGMKVVAMVDARTLIPYLADAVPGWFQATVALYDSRGNEVAYADDFQFHPDPVLRYEIPADGDYTVAIKDSIYRGREDFVYRIALGEFPFITGIFPLGGGAGERTQVELMGWNLPEKHLAVQPKETDPQRIEISVVKEGRKSNPVPFAVGSLPEVMETEPNDLRSASQQVSLPVVVNGQINGKGDWDVYRVGGRAGDVVVAEVFARRLGSPLDSILKLTDHQGNELAVNDDHEDKAAGLVTHHADSRIQTTLPANGDFYLQVGDTQGKGGEAYSYRLQLTPLQPGFELRVVPSSIAVRAGSSVPLTVHVLRVDGFTNDIQLALAEAPDGFSLGNALLSARTNQFRVLLKASPSVVRKPCTVQMEGRAQSNGHKIVRSAVPADDLMQAFIYRHLVPADEMKVAVIGRAPSRKPAKNRTTSSKPATKPAAPK